MQTHRLSKQRKILLERLAGTREHPTATTLHQWIKAEMPNLSLGTVYRNLGILKQQGKIRELTGQGKQSHFDADLQPHAHFYCRVCDSVYDLSLNQVLLERLQHTTPTGFLMERVDVDIKGICLVCTSKHAQSSRRKHK